MQAEMKSVWGCVMNGIKLFVVLALLFSFITPGAVSAEEAEAGKTLLTSGSVLGKRTEGDVILKRRSIIYEKDEIHVGADSKAQFRMIDKALISLHENSILQIKKYQYKEGEGRNSALLELISGGLRTITGAIGKNNKKAYELRTPLATIGIRGTHYEVQIVPNGMYVSVWEGVIILRSRLKGGCNILLGVNKPYQFVFIDRLGFCRGLEQVPRLPDDEVVTPEARLVRPSYNAFTIDESQPSKELSATASALNTPTPTFSVGLNSLNVLNNSVTDYQQSVGGYAVSWGYWGELSSNGIARDITNPADSGLIWSTYEATDPDIVGARTGSFSRYETINDSLLSGSQGVVSNLAVQMDVNFDTGNVSNGALSANTPNDTWVAVFDGQIQAGDLDLQMNGASVIDSNPATASPARDASGFIAGDFVGANAEAIIGAFGLSENGNPTNHIEGVFVVEEIQGGN